MSNLTHLQGRNTKGKFMSRILEQIYVDPKHDPDPKPTEKKDPDPKKIIPDPRHCWYDKCTDVCINLIFDLLGLSFGD
jgi:hypothetical protein